jgi:ubiquinone/menaquinone biosynthesis C-methylase UbiE
LADKHRALAFYAVLSAAYDCLNPGFYTAKMRAEVVAPVSEGSVCVLDVGCGTGYTTAGLLQQKGVCEVVGLDMNPVQLRRAAKNLSVEKTRASLWRGDAENLPFDDATFDAVVSVGAIEYFPNPQKAVGEFARVSKSNAAVVVGGPENGWFRRFGLDKFFYTPSAAELEVFFSEAGLSQVRSRLIGLDSVFGTSKYVVVTSGVKPA